MPPDTGILKMLKDLVAPKPEFKKAARHKYAPGQCWQAKSNQPSDTNNKGQG
jgi:hypothetical protein